MIAGVESATAKALRVISSPVAITSMLVICALMTAPVAAHANEGDRVVSTVAPTDGTSLAGTWWIADYSPQLITSNLAAIPFMAAGKAVYDRNAAQLRAGTLVDAARTKCLPEGLPRTLFAPYPMQIVQHGTLVTFIHEVNHIFWSASLRDPHPGPDDLDPAFMGDSIGRWQGDTLVIDSIGFKDSFLDDSAMPHGPKLQVVTRLRRLNRQALEITSTVTDPDYFTTPFTVRHTYELRPDVVIQEYVCGEEHRVLTGSRASGVQLNWVAK